MKLLLPSAELAVFPVLTCLLSRTKNFGFSEGSRETTDYSPHMLGQGGRGKGFHTLQPYFPGMCRSPGSLSYSPAADDSEQHCNNCYHQKNVDKTAHGVRRNEP